MKKILALLLAAVMCFSLVACGRETTNANDDSSSQQETEQADASQENSGQVVGSQTSDSAVISQIKDKIAETERCVAIIRVQINPAFDIYLDENNNVLAVDYINSDAQQALSDIDVIGQNGMDALQVLVIAVLHTELAEEDVVVYITPVYQEENALTSELINDIPFVLSQLQTSSQSDASISVEFDDDGIIEIQDSNNTVPTDDTEATDDENADNDTDTTTDDDGNNTEVIKDKNGNIIKTVDVDDAGNIHTCYFDERGLITKEIMECLDGSYEESNFADGVLTQRILKDTEKTTTLYFDGNGTVKESIETHSDGMVYIRMYHANGEIKEATEKHPAGDYTTQTFDANGIKLTQESAYVNGAGTLIWSKFLYDAGGNVTEYYGQDNFGRPVHKIYNSDGSSVTFRTEADGSTTTIYYDSNGNIIHP